VPPPLDRTQIVPYGLTRLQDRVAPDNIYWGQTGVLRNWTVDESVAVEFRNRF
jgi:hypothetical protein